MQAQLKMKIAAHFLSGICRDDSTKSPNEREAEFRNALATAEAFIALAGAEGSPAAALEYAPPRFQAAKPVQERAVERVPLATLLEARRQTDAKPQTKGPRFH